MKIVTLIFGLLFTLSIQAQQRLYFDFDWDACKKKRASYYRVLGANTDNGLVAVKDYTIYDKLVKEASVKANNPEILEGPFTAYRGKGTVKETGSYKNGLLHGDFTEYHLITP